MGKSIAISEKGHKILKNRKLSAEIVDLIMKNKKNLQDGKALVTKDGVAIRLTTSTPFEKSNVSNSD